ncbi:MAG: hypothetical protein JWM98_2316 [Thermoleophilia bacterium]|nr:hypothetical protein [Thermoleophilia bacterium]
MTSLLVLALILIASWAWTLWQRDGAAAFARDWGYVLLVGGVVCLVMSIGLWIRAHA